MSHFHRASENDVYFPSLEFWKLKLVTRVPRVILKPFVPGEI